MSSSIGEKVKHALHLDKSHSTTHSHNDGLTTGNTANTGYGNSGTAEGVAGPHSSRIANAADPRIDSDLDGSRNAGARTHNTTHTGAGYTGNEYGSTNAGPHSSNIANKLDPRVDSDRDGSRNLGSNSNGAYSGTHTGNHVGHTGTVGGLSNSTNAGPHNSNLLNKADPRVDSDLDGRGNRHGAPTGGILGASGSHATAGSGTAQNTAGPHNSDLLNQVDPRVDSDRDNSKTFGGNRTHA